MPARIAGPSLAGRAGIGTGEKIEAKGASRPVRAGAGASRVASSMRSAGSALVRLRESLLPLAERHQATHWTGRAMAKAIRISLGSV